MTVTTTPTETAQASDLFAQRCAEMGLALWNCDANGNITREPDAPAPLLPWLRSKEVRTRMQSAALAISAANDRQPARFMQGCWLTPLSTGRGVRREPFALVLTVEPGSVALIDLETTCAGTGLDPSAVRAGLMELASPNGSHSSRMVSLLRWMHADLTGNTRDSRTLGEFSEKLVQAYEEINLLFRLARFANSMHEPAHLMRTFCQQLQQILPFRWTAVRFMAESNGVPDLAGKLIVAGELPCDSALFESILAGLMDRWRSDNWTRMLEPRSSELAALVGSEIIIDPVTHDGRVVGAILAGNKQGDDPDLSSVETQFIDAAADFLGVFHENVARFTEQRALFLGTLQSLTASIDAKDPYTCGHSERVSLLATQMATAMGLSREQVEHFRIAGLVHDVGKIGVPEAVLCKTSRLTDEEFGLIKKHPEIGHHILKDISLMADELPGVLHHHERWDGRGYPHKLKGEEIPLIARVLALADTFDAMSSNRAYRSALPRAKVLAEINHCGGTQFDPSLVSAFVSLSYDEYDAMLARQRAAQAPDAPSPAAA
ncbi:MAG: HD-GYP domain-containing protein [Planctomycetes bacterium]|nr:HD-GYP domain-containing protein [Planctomycetota bacterium]